MSASKLKALRLVALFLVLQVPAWAEFPPNRLPQIANGTGNGFTITTTIIVFNYGTEVGHVLFTFNHANGELWEEIHIPGLPSGAVTGLTLEPGQSRFLRTTGLGNLEVGSASVAWSGSIGTSAIYSIAQEDGPLVTEAGIGLAKAVTEADIGVNTMSPFNTGVAVFNLVPRSNQLTFERYNAEGMLQSAKAFRTLPSFGQLAEFVRGDLFPNLGNFRGKLRLKSDEPIAVVTLRQAGASVLTTLPAVPSDSFRTSFRLPQIANGHGIRTQFVIFNLGSQPGMVALNLTNDSGDPFAVALSGLPADSQFDLAIPGNGTLFLETDGTGPVMTGAARVDTTVPVGVTAVFSLLNESWSVEVEAGVGDSPERLEAALPVDLVSGFDTGIALFNPAAEAAVVDFRILESDGEPLPDQVDGIPSITIPPLGHRAVFVSEIEPEAQGIRGQLAVISSRPVSAVSLRQGAGTLTTLPVFQVGDEGNGNQVSSRLLPAERKGLALTQSTVVNQVLSDGITISGNYTVPVVGYLPKAVFAQAFNGPPFPGTLDFENQAYRVVVPAGSYDLSFCSEVPSTMVGTADVSFSTILRSNQRVQHMVYGVDAVAADVKRDVALLLPPIWRVSGSLSGLSALPEGTPVALSFKSELAPTEGYAEVNEDGSFGVKLAAGTYSVSALFGSVWGDDPEGEPLSGQLFGEIWDIGSLKVMDSNIEGRNLALPALVRVTGNVIQPETPSFAGGRVLAVDESAPSWDSPGCCFSAPAGSVRYGLSSSPDYALRLARGLTYEITGSVPITGGTTSSPGFLQAPLGNLHSFAGESQLDISLPSKPAEVSLSGWVTGPDGLPVAGVEVMVTNRGGLEGIPAAAFEASATTDRAGYYSLTVLSGSGYEIRFLPPALVVAE